MTNLAPAGTVEASPIGIQDPNRDQRIGEGKCLQRHKSKKSALIRSAHARFQPIRNSVATRVRAEELSRLPERVVAANILDAWERKRWRRNQVSMVQRFQSFHRDKLEILKPLNLETVPFRAAGRLLTLPSKQHEYVLESMVVRYAQHRNIVLCVLVDASRRDSLIPLQRSYDIFPVALKGTVSIS